MAHRPKRRKVSDEEDQLVATPTSHGLPSISSIGVNSQNRPILGNGAIKPFLIDTSDLAQSKPQSLPIYNEIPLALPEVTSTPTRIHKRDGIDIATALATAIETVTTDVVDIVLDTGTSQLAEITLPAFPTGPTVLQFPDYGPVTIAAVTTVAVPPIPTLPIVTAAPSLLPVPTFLNPPSNPTTVLPPAAPSSMSINVPEFQSSQVVLSTPPPTPIPSSSGMSFPSASSSETDTYFPPVSATTNSTLATDGLMIATTSSSNTLTTTNTPSYYAGNATWGGSTFQVPVTLMVLTSSQTTQTTLSTTTSSKTSASSSSNTNLGTGIVAGGGNPAATGAPSSATSTAAGAGGATTDNSTVATPAVVGGVVGGIAGLTIILVLLLFIIRWKRHRMIRAGALSGGDTEDNRPDTAQSRAAMAQAAAPFAAAGTGVMPFFRKLRPNSGQTQYSATDSATTERGFQKLGGRKIESVLVSGGDGYGGLAPGSAGNVSSSSFYRDSQGTYGGPGSLRSSLAVGPASPPQSPSRVGAYDSSGLDKEVAVLRSGPARSPGFVASSPRGANTLSQHSPLVPPDPLGRSHPSLDGSRGSKFAENL